MAEQQSDRLSSLKQKYQATLDYIQQSGVRLSHMHVQDDKLFLQGEAPSEQIKNRVWDTIKRVDPAYSDLICDLMVNPSLPQPASQNAAQQAGTAAAGGAGNLGGGVQTYTVKAGDSLSKISQQFYGNGHDYMKIFEANRDQLKDPDSIRPGQTLTIPAK
jgi:hypothetical protein